MKTKICAEEIIGKNIQVLTSKNKNEEGITGKVLDETKKMLVVATPDGEKKLLKSNITLTIEGKKVEGKQLLKRPEERIK